jgi:hypothetical protein
MSCFVVDDKTIHHIAPLFAPDQASCEQIDLIGRVMLRMNYTAHTTRYRQTDTPELADLYRYHPMGTVPAIQRLKSLQCWLYQCMESESLIKHPLYIQGREIERRLMQEIITALPEYQTASWS